MKLRIIDLRDRLRRYRRMDKNQAIIKLMELKKLQRNMESLAEELGVGDISEDKIYIAITAYRAALIKIYNIRE